jgi:hypothetical protein
MRPSFSAGPQHNEEDCCVAGYIRRACVIGFQGAWIWVQDKAEIRRHITHMASIFNAVMRSKTGDMEARNSGAPDMAIR